MLVSPASTIHPPHHAIFIPRSQVLSSRNASVFRLTVPAGRLLYRARARAREFSHLPFRHRRRRRRRSLCKIPNLTPAAFAVLTYNTITFVIKITVIIIMYASAYGWCAFTRVWIVAGFRIFWTSFMILYT